MNVGNSDSDSDEPLASPQTSRLFLFNTKDKESPVPSQANQSPPGESMQCIKDYQVQNVFEGLEEQVELDELKSYQKKVSTSSRHVRSQMDEDDFDQFMPVKKEDDFLCDKFTDTNDLPKMITEQATDTDDLRAIYISKQVQTLEVEKPVIKCENQETQTTDLPDDIENRMKGSAHLRARRPSSIPRLALTTPSFTLFPTALVSAFMFAQRLMLPKNLGRNSRTPGYEI